MTRTIMRAAAAIALTLPTAGFAGDKLTKAERAAIDMAPEQIAAIAEVKNDSLDRLIRISTRPFFEEAKKGGDKFFRAYIDKKTGDARFQVYAWIRYDGETRDFDRVNYETPAGLVSEEVHQIDIDVLGCSARYCTYTEDIAFDVPEATLRQIAAGAKAGETWRFKIFGRFADGIETEMLKTEAAAILIAADRERAQLKK